jgi:hypothetical protein
MLPSEVDPSRYPHLAAYLAQLPDGLRSYPECKSKGTLVVSAIEGHDLSAIGDGLPPDLLAMLRQPPPVGVWVPAVFSDAVFYVLVDAFYPSKDAVLKWTFDRTIRTASSRVYRALTRAAGPSTLLRMTAAVHRLFQRGTYLESKRIGKSVELRLRHPPYLHGGLNHVSNVALFRALLHYTGASDIDVEMIASEPTQALYVARWT